MKKKTMPIAALFVALATLCGCTHTEITDTLPVVKTYEITEFTSSMAYAKGNVADNGTLVTERGFCYSTTSTKPTVNDSHTSDGSGSGDYESIIMGLQKSTTYHMRAYAKNESGVAYGETVTFTTYEKDEDYYANLLSRHPNGWKLTSATSAPYYIMPDGTWVTLRQHTSSYSKRTTHIM